MGICSAKRTVGLISGRDLVPSEYSTDGAGMPYITGASNFVDGKVELISEMDNFATSDI